MKKYTEEEIVDAMLILENAGFIVVNKPLG